MRKSEPDVLVAGGGPVGLFTALALARRDLSVRIVEEEWRPTGRSYALALHPESLRLLHEIEGLGKLLLAKGQRIDVLAYYEGAARRRERRLGDLPVPFPFVLVLSQHDLESLLTDALAASGVEVEWNHRLAALDERSEDGLSVDVNRLEKTSSGYAVLGTEWCVHSTRRAQPRFLIGADGHRSTVRSLMGLDSETTGPSELYAVFEFGAEGGSLPDEARFTTDDAGTSVLWPLPGGRFRWSVPLDDDGSPMWRTKSRLAVSVIDANDRSALANLLHARLPWFTATPRDLSWATTVRFEHRVASLFGRGRVWLAGDAAHLGGPLGVQSMNAGLREGAHLAASLDAIVHHQAPVGLLERYGETARAEWKALADQPVAPLFEPLPRSEATASRS